MNNKQMKIRQKAIFAPLLATGLLLLAGCTSFNKTVDFYPALPYESRAASYQPIKPVRKELHYYRDRDSFFQPWLVLITYGLAYIPLGEESYEHVDEKYYNLASGKKEPLFGEGEEYYEYNHNLKARKTTQIPTEIGYVLAELKKEVPEMDILLNARVEQECEEDHYFLWPILPYFIWNMRDSDCKMVLTGMAAKVR